jgi:hypothetical protein
VQGPSQWLRQAGGNLVTVVPVANAYGVGVDSTNIYWTDFRLGAVLAAPLAGGVPVTLASGQTNPYDIVDVLGRIVSAIDEAPYRQCIDDVFWS